MHQFASLPKFQQEFITWLNNSGQSRTKLVSFAIAKAIADQLPVSGKVENIGNFYRISHEINVISSISCLNEMAVIDVEVIKNYVRNLYIWRYRVANQPYVCMLTKPETAKTDFFGIGEATDADVLCEVEKDTTIAMKVYNGTTAVIQAISAIKV